jgi:hypothetical protein
MVARLVVQGLDPGEITVVAWNCRVGVDVALAGLLARSSAKKSGTSAGWREHSAGSRPPSPSPGRHRRARPHRGRRRRAGDDNKEGADVGLGSVGQVSGAGGHRAGEVGRPLVAVTQTGRRLRSLCLPGSRRGAPPHIWYWRCSILGKSSPVPLRTVEDLELSVSNGWNASTLALDDPPSPPAEFGWSRVPRRPSVLPAAGFQRAATRVRCNRGDGRARRR